MKDNSILKGAIIFLRCLRTDLYNHISDNKSLSLDICIYMNSLYLLVEYPFR